jgi:trigger factor
VKIVKTSQEKIENKQVFLRIEIEPNELEEAMGKAYLRVVNRTKIPGFRQGKAPRTVLERYVGKEDMFEEALKIIVPDAYEKALKEHDVRAFASPTIEIINTNPIIFKAIVPLAPEVKLGAYQEIRLLPEKTGITDEEVSRTLEQIRHQQADWEPVERPVRANDLAVLNITSTLEEKSFINQKGAQYQVIEGASFPAPGFPEQIVGMKREEGKEFKLQFPADYPRTELAGKEALFNVRVTEIKEEKLPELNDAFAKQVNPETNSLEELRQRLSKELEDRAVAKARLDFEEQLLDKAVESSTIEFPPIMIESEIERMMRQMGDKNIQDYYDRNKKTEEDLRQELEPLAIKRIKRSLVLGQIAVAEKIETAYTEIESEVEEMIQRTEKKDEMRQFLNTPQARESLSNQIITRKAIQKLVDIAGTAKSE